MNLLLRVRRRNSSGDLHVPMLPQPGHQFFKMLLMMIIRSYENESERVSFQLWVSSPIQQVSFRDPLR